VIAGNMLAERERTSLGYALTSTTWQQTRSASRRRVNHPGVFQAVRPSGLHVFKAPDRKAAPSDHQSMRSDVAKKWLPSAMNVLLKSLEGCRVRQTGTCSRSDGTA